MAFEKCVPSEKLNEMSRYFASRNQNFACYSQNSGNDASLVQLLSIYWFLSKAV